MCLRGVAIGSRLLRRRTLRPDPAGKPLDPAVAPPVDSPPMTDLDEQGRPEPPLAADETATLRLTRWTGRPTPTGTGTRPPRTPPSSSRRSGRTPWPAPAPWSRRRWPTAAWSGWPGAPGPRWILFHLVEEYARHNGHADLLRESVDGLTGE